MTLNITNTIKRCLGNELLMKNLLTGLFWGIIIVLIMLSAFWVKFINFILIPINILLDLSFVLLPVFFTVITGLFLYTFISKNYRKFNRLYEGLFILVLLGFSSIFFDNLFFRTAFFGKAECIELYTILFVLLLFISLVIYLRQKNDTRYYLIPFLILLVICLYKFILFFE